MARTAVLSKPQIIKCAFDIAREKGRSAITIREIGKRLEKSTAPIYTQYPSIDAIILDLVTHINKLVHESSTKNRTNNKFLDSGVGFLAFVMENKLIFNDFFLSSNEERFGITQDVSFYLEIMKQSPFINVLGDDRLLKILEDIQIYTYGLAIMICANIGPGNDLSYYEQKLEQVGNALMGYHMYSSGKYELAVQQLVDKFSEGKNNKEVKKK